MKIVNKALRLLTNIIFVMFLSGFTYSLLIHLFPSVMIRYPVVYNQESIDISSEIKWVREALKDYPQAEIPQLNLVQFIPFFLLFENQIIHNNNTIYTNKPLSREEIKLILLKAVDARESGGDYDRNYLTKSIIRADDNYIEKIKKEGLRQWYYSFYGSTITISSKLPFIEPLSERITPYSDLNLNLNNCISESDCIENL